MWLATKEAAGRAKPHSDSYLLDQLGDPEAVRQYKRWARDYPEIQQGPEQGVTEHYQKLKSTFERENAQSGEGQGPRTRGLTVDKRPVITERAVPRDVPSAVRTPEELRAEQTWENFSPSNGLPTRIPGQYTTGNPEFGTRPFAGWELPPENQPLHTAPRAPMRTPKPQSMQDWVNFLRGKGITVNHQLMRPDAVQMQGPMLQGQDIWKDFIGPTTDESYAQHLKELPESAGGLGRSWRQRLFGPRKAASTIVTSYIEGVLVGEVMDTIQVTAELDPAAAFWDRFNRMKRAGWDFTESGSGNHWHKEINGKHHFLVGEPDGWTHYISNSPTSYAGSVGYGPIPNLDEAVLDAKIGPLKQMALPRQREREEMYKSLWGETRPIGRMVPPEETNGMMQRLNYTFRWEE